MNFRFDFGEECDRRFYDRFYNGVRPRNTCTKKKKETKQQTELTQKYFRTFFSIL